jgi:hypothetical protein
MLLLVLLLTILGIALFVYASSLKRTPRNRMDKTPTGARRADDGRRNGNFEDPQRTWFWTYWSG